MANPSPPSQSSVVLFPFLLLLLLPTTTAASPPSAGLNSDAPFQELETMLETLRNHGYILFTNAIATSDLQYQLLTTINNNNVTTSAASEDKPPPSTSPFTLFAPTDELLFTLDMSSDADDYVSTLKYHVIPDRRHTFADLKNLTSPFLETLLPHYSVLIGKTRDGHVDLLDNATVGVIVDGVRLNRPDLFVGSRIAVHGIDGILLTGLNLYHQFDGDDNGSDLLAPAGSPAEMPVFERNTTEKGTLPPISQSERENIHAKIPVTPPKDNAEKKKMGRHRRASRGGHRRVSKGGHRRRRFEDL